MLKRREGAKLTKAADADERDLARSRARGANGASVDLPGTVMTGADGNQNFRNAHLPNTHLPSIV